MSRLIFRAVYDFSSLGERANFIRSNPSTPPERMYRVRARRKSFAEELPVEPRADPTCPEHCPDMMGPPDVTDPAGGGPS